jgi:hemoglobin
MPSVLEEPRGRWSLGGSTNPIIEDMTMTQAVSTSITRRSVLAGLALTAAPAALLGEANKAHAQAKQSAPENSLYERLGGVFAIAAVVNHFSDAVVKNPIVGRKSKNPRLREWHTKNLKRLPGLKFMRTLWVCNVSGGPFQFTATKPGTTPLGLEEAHRDLRISPAEFDEVAAELGRTLDFAKVPKREKAEVLAAFAAHKDEVTAGYVAANKRS